METPSATSIGSDINDAQRRVDIDEHGPPLVVLVRHAGVHVPEYRLEAKKLLKAWLLS